MQNNVPLEKISAEIAALSKAIVELHRRVGIRDFDLYTTHERAQRRREAYFAIADTTFRKDLIAKDRQLEELLREEARLQVQNAEAALKDAHKSGRSVWVLTPSIGIGCVVYGYQFFDLVGAIGGAVLGLSISRLLEAEVFSARQTKIAAAENALDDARTIERVTEPSTFSPEEANTGKPATKVRA
jgi:hypothetical protein